jgi:ubiquitin carboxyl-terminal hydrolase 36/42
LEINQVDNLEDALKSFTKVEQIGDSEEKLTCEHCKAKVYKNKQLILDKAPDVLAFQLKRFTTIDNSIEKIDKHVAYPLELDLMPFHSNPDTAVSSSIPSACLEVGSCSRNFRLTI